MENMVIALKQEHPLLQKFDIATIRYLLSQRKGVMMMRKGDILFKTEEE